MAMFTVLLSIDAAADPGTARANEAALTFSGLISRAPICLLLTLAECAAVMWIYCVCLRWQGDLFQARDQQILEVGTGRAAHLCS